MPENKPIYLDYNATTPIAKEVADAMAPYLYEHFGNPSSTHPYGVRAKLAIENARKQVASTINCEPNEVIFTSGGTKNNNTAIPGLARIPIIGPILFNTNLFVYLMLILLIIIQVALFSTCWGLWLQYVGEHPKAADTLGINLIKTHYLAVILSGIVAGIGSAFLTLGSVGRFDEGMTAGKGFIGLAAMIFSNWTPIGSLGAGLPVWLCRRHRFQIILAGQCDSCPNYGDGPLSDYHDRAGRVYRQRSCPRHQRRTLC